MIVAEKNRNHFLAITCHGPKGQSDKDFYTFRTILQTFPIVLKCINMCLGHYTLNYLKVYFFLEVDLVMVKL